MNTTDQPEPQRAFNPVGHVMLAFATPQEMQGAHAALLAGGFKANELHTYTPQQMQMQARINIEQAGVLAGLGQDLNLMKADLALAEEGHSFLAVHAPKDEATHVVTEVAQRFRATRAQKYGWFVVEELIDPTPGEAQVFESGDRGLDTPVNGADESSERVGAGA